MDWLFSELHGMFGNKFLDAFRSGHIAGGKDTGIENMRAVWAAKIRSNKLMMDDVRRGVSVCERMKWPPTWGEFLEACAPSLDVDLALNEACEQILRRPDGTDKWTDPAIFWAAIRVGHDAFKNLPRRDLRSQFAAALEEVRRKGDVAPVPVNVPALPDKGAGVTDAETAKRNLRNVRDMLEKTGVVVQRDRGGRSHGVTA